MNRILVVDDSKMIVSMLEKAILKTIDNVEVLTAYTSKDALKYILKYGDKIDVAILDLHLPDSKDGAIVNVVESTGIKSIVLSGILDEKLKKIIFDKTYIIDCIAKDGEKSIKSTIFAVERALKNKNKNILLVDDSKVQLSSAIVILKKMNLNVTTANNGQEALEIINKNEKKYSLVLTDYNMPVMDGMDLTFKLREKYDKDELGIVVLSTTDNPEITSQFLKIGANDFINKPYSEIEFITRVNGNLDSIELFENIKVEHKKSKEKDNIINEQNKMLSMNQLIRNIAHHWRQPLSAISTSAGAIRLDSELDMLTTDKLHKFLDTIMERSEFLSNTLETFKDMTSTNTNIENIILQDELEKVINLNLYNMEDQNIEVVKSFPDQAVELEVEEGSLSKILIYILNNSYDALEKKDSNKQIKISLESSTDSILISIFDNGGGIDEKILPHIFEPYFTTKHQSPGTGLSLHLAFQLVTEHLYGKIYAKNIDDGVCLYIELPSKKICSLN